MKNKIHNLITRQLGELPEEINTWSDVDKLLASMRYPEKLTIQYGFDFFKRVHKQETEKRELLDGLIAIVYIHHKTTKEYIPVKMISDVYKQEIQLIEKSLSMKWPDIVQYLEGEG